jgi:hypothetical protein
LQTHQVTLKRPRLHILWFLVAIAAFLTAGVAALAFYSRYSYSGRIAAIRAAGDPISIADLAPKPVPAKDNAAVYLDAVKARLEAFAKEQYRFTQSPEGKVYQAATERSEPALPEHIAAMRAILDKYSDVDAKLDQAAACDAYASQLDYSLPPDRFIDAAMDSWTDERSVGRFITWQMEVAIAEGRTDDAVKLGLRLLRLARMYGAEPTVSASLVVMAIYAGAAPRVYESLASGEISIALHQQLDDELATCIKSLESDAALKSERAFNIDALKSQFGVLGSLPIGWPLRSHNAETLDFYDRMLPAMQMSWHDQRNQPGGSVFAATQGSVTTGSMLLPAMHAWFEAKNRTIAMLRSLQIYNAIQEFAITNGREANSLIELALPAAATVDPFSGKPLVMTKTDDGWLIYSVGRDGVDDGGNFKTLKDYGVGPRKPAK